MLQQIILQNFKCFDILNVTCAPLTLLCGVNGMGKSSVIQSLLILRQIVRERSFDERLPDAGWQHGRLGNWYGCTV